MRVIATDWLSPRQLSRRRRAFFTGVFFLTSIAVWFMADLMWRNGMGATDWAPLILFTVLFAQIAVGFVTAMIGFYVLNRGGDRKRIEVTIQPGEEVPLASTAIIMPVFNEDVSRVFEGLRVIYRSVQETKKLEHFDFFILSDSNQPNQWIKEEVAWVELCKQVGGFGRIFYRKRRQQINKKAGNVADFLRRWGKSYRYMVVLDADSIMTGEALVKMVQLMEKNPTAGIIQTAPRLVNGETLYARLQQFANRLYSPIFLAGLNFWQQDEGNYWGHNAIIRVQPFIEHCALPDLPGSEPFGGTILSHDFVEAALMRRAGWAVWLATEIDGTYEEGPPTLIDSAKRDRRWCQGNMQHSWLLLAKGFKPTNRFHLLMGVMAYVSSPLWLLFLMLSTLQAFSQARQNDYLFRAEAYTSIFGYRIEVPEAFTLFVLTMLMLFTPKVLSVIRAWQDSETAEKFGGRSRLLVSALLEMVTSAVLAPINMLFNSKFVVYTLLGHGVSWVTQRRGAGDDADWREAILTHWPHTVFGVVWAASSYILVPSFFWWALPVMAGMILSIPVSIILSNNSFGRKSQSVGLFITPEESKPPYELRRLRQNLDECYKHLQPLDLLRNDYGMLQAVVDPYVNAVHVSLLRQRRPSEESRDYFQTLRTKLLRDGPSTLTTKEKMALLLDAESMIWLHEELWRSPSHALAEWWRLAVRQYNVLTAAPITALYR